MSNIPFKYAEQRIDHFPPYANRLAQFLARPGSSTPWLGCDPAQSLMHLFGEEYCEVFRLLVLFGLREGEPIRVSCYTFGHAAYEDALATAASKGARIRLYASKSYARSSEAMRIALTRLNQVSGVKIWMVEGEAVSHGCQPERKCEQRKVDEGMGAARVHA